MRTRVLVLLSILLLMAGTAAIAGSLYTTTSIQSSNADLCAYAMNAAGKVVGYDGISNRGFYWDNGLVVFLPRLAGATDSFALDINDQGDIVGSSGDHAVLWRGGKAIDLGITSGYISCQAVRINNLGQIIANATTSDYSSMPMLWKNGSWYVIGNKYGTAYDINDSGQAVGTYQSGGTFLWQNGKITDLSLGEACGINSSGQIVGYYNRHAALWQNGSILDLSPNLSSGMFAHANKISNRGQIVGQIHFPDPHGYPAMWYRSGREQVVPGSDCGSAVDVNDAGQILCNGEYYPDFLLTPKPPQDISLLPNGGYFKTGMRYTFSSIYVDANVDTISNAYLLITVGSARTNAAYVKYEPGSNLLWVRNDSDGAWIGGFAPGSDNVIENSACKLYCKETTVDSSGNVAVVKWRLEFKSLLAGKFCTAWMKAFDDRNMTYNFKKMGDMTITAKSLSPVTNASLNPMMHSANSGDVDTLIAQYTDINGAADISQAYFLINTSYTTTNASYFKYDAISNRLYMRDSTNQTWTGGYAPGSNNDFWTNFGILHCSGCSITKSGNVLTIKWNIEFTYSDDVTLGVWMNAVGKSGTSPGFQELGTIFLNQYYQ